MKTYDFFCCSRPNAKINLALFVTGKRTDGYHNIETLFVPIPLCDEMDFAWADGVDDVLILDGLACDARAADNLVLRAVALLRRYGHLDPLLIRLKKNIPMGAGLGGGSSDAAFTLQVLAPLLSPALDPQKLPELAASLGSDCPFFLQNLPALAYGRGEKLLPYTLDLSAYALVLLFPDISVSTADAYAEITPQPAPQNWEQLNNCPVAAWPNRIGNDFERTVFTRYPSLELLKQQLYQWGAEYAAMSGSGSTLFALFDPQKQPSEGALNGLGIRWWSVANLVQTKPL